MSSGKLFIVTLALLMIGVRGQLNADFNAQAKDIADKRDAWCRSSNAYDRNYNASEKAYYRSTRQTIYSDSVTDSFLFYNNYDTTRWIQTMRWATGLLLVLIILSFISWIIWLGFCCAPKESNPSPMFMRFCILLGWLAFIAFLGLFVIIMIFIAASEVSQRRSKCAYLNIGSMLVNGYKSIYNGNQYAGLQTINQVLKNLQVETPNLVTAVPAAQSVLSSTNQYWANQAWASLGQIYQNNWLKTTVGPLSQTIQGDFLQNLTPTVSPALADDFGRLVSTATYFNNAAQAVPNLGNSGNQNVVSQTLGYLISNINSMTADVSDLTLILWNRGWTRYTFSTGAYWAIFAVSIVLIILIGVALGYLNKAWADDRVNSNVTAFKVILGLAGFFLVWYGILVIILLAGSTSIATFCTVLSQVNQNNVGVLDQLPVGWENNKYGMTKSIIKHCVAGQSGDLLDFANSYTNPGYSSVTATQIKSLIYGLVAYKAFINNPILLNGSPAANLYNSYLSTVASAVTEDAAGVREQDQILSKLISGSGQVNAVSSSLCTFQSANSNCLKDDVINSWNALASSPNVTLFLPYYNNLQAYILSEQSVVASLQSQLMNGVNSANYNYNMSTWVLAQQQANYNSILSTLPGTAAVLSKYRGGLSAFDCRNVRQELAILEDHLCFELNYWVNILVIISAISFCLLFILLWAIFSAARHSEGERVISTIPVPVPDPNPVKEDPALDINERENIPSM